MEDLEKIRKAKLERIKKVIKFRENPIREIREEEFEDWVVEVSKEVPVLVDFWADWCYPCKMLAPILEKVVLELKGKILLAKINVDKNRELAEKFGIASIPFVLLFKNGKPVDGFVGALSESEVREWLKNKI